MKRLKAIIYSVQVIFMPMFFYGNKIQTCPDSLENFQNFRQFPFIVSQFVSIVASQFPSADTDKCEIL